MGWNMDTEHKDGSIVGEKKKERKKEKNPVWPVMVVHNRSSQE